MMAKDRKRIATEKHSSLTNNKFFWRLTALGGSHSIDEKIAQPQD
jgi:hypothetical protein